MKKILSALAAFVLLFELSTPLSTTVNAYGSVYENITNEVLQVQSYMNNKMYLEAIQLCENTKYYRYISYEDKALLDQYIYNAKTAYSNYLNNEKQTKTTQHYIADWCLGYKFFEAYSPDYYYDNHYDDYAIDYSGELYSINVYSEQYDSIYIYSYGIGSACDLIYSLVESPQQFVSAYGKRLKELLNYGYSNFDHLEIISENNTTVGNLPARQITLRTSKNLNRYGTKKEYCIERCTAFQYGDWVYVIMASKNAYSWGDDFWNKMELVRKTISFY